MWADALELDNQIEIISHPFFLSFFFLMPAPDDGSGDINPSSKAGTLFMKLTISFKERDNLFENLLSFRENLTN